MVKILLLGIGSQGGKMGKKRVSTTNLEFHLKLGEFIIHPSAAFCLRHLSSLSGEGFSVGILEVHQVYSYHLRIGPMRKTPSVHPINAHAKIPIHKFSFLHINGPGPDP